jgi:hypothetical protein
VIYTTGDLRQCMGEDFMKNVYAVINRNQHRAEPYWLLVHTSVIGRHVHTRIVIMGRENFVRDDQGRVIPLLDTILLKVDNRKGDLEVVWALPADIPDTQAIYGDVVESVAEQAWNLNMPIINA